MRNLPRYKKCFVCGKENPIGLNVTFKTDNKKVYASITLDNRYIGYADRIHGGIAASLLDEIMGWSCSVVTKKLYYTAELTVKYKKPIPSNCELFFEAEMAAQKHSLCLAKAELRDAQNNILAQANGKYFPINDESEYEILRMLHHEPEDNSPVTKDDI